MSSSPNCFQTPNWTSNWNAWVMAHWSVTMEKNRKENKKEKQQNMFNGFGLWVFRVVYLKWHIYKCQEEFHKYLLSAHLVPGTIIGTCDSSLTDLVAVVRAFWTCSHYTLLSITLCLTFYCQWGQIWDLEFSRMRWHLTDWQLWFTVNILYL